jgi:uncharacterized membrane protein
MIGLLLAMYPARWRQRYGEEFRIVLESRPLGPFDVADVLIGALDARLTRFRFAGAAGTDGGPLMMLRLGGFGAIAGGALWFLGIAVASALGDRQGAPWMFVAMVGTVGLLLALVGLSAFQAHRQPGLTWAAFAIPAVGTVVSIVGMFGMATRTSDAPLVGSLGPWEIWILGMLAMLVGSILFAVASIRAGVLSRRAAQSLAITAAAIIFVASGVSGVVDSGTATILAATSLASFGGSWMALGFSALRRGPIRATAPA